MAGWISCYSPVLCTSKWRKYRIKIKGMAKIQGSFKIALTNRDVIEESSCQACFRHTATKRRSSEERETMSFYDTTMNRRKDEGLKNQENRVDPSRKGYITSVIYAFLRLVRLSRHTSVSPLQGPSECPRARQLGGRRVRPVQVREGVYGSASVGFRRSPVD